MPITQQRALTPNNEERVSSTTHPKNSAETTKPTKLLDETEAEERHGGQYHLRHHLSGCAQTLYTVDFEEIINPVSASSDSSSPLMPNDIAQQNSTVAASAHNLNASAELSLSPGTSQPLPIEIAASALGGETTSNIQAGEVLNTPHGLNEISLSGEFTAPSEDSPIIAISENLESSAQLGITDSVAQYDGWQINSAIAIQLNEGGQILVDDSLVENSTLLTQQLQISADSHYQFNMRMIMDDNSEPPAFALNIDGEEIPLTAIRVAEGYQLHGELVSSNTDTKTISLVAKSPLPSGHHLYIDHPVFEIMLPKPVSVHLPEEPVFDFAAITVIEPEIISNKAEVTFTDKNLLVDVHAELAITPAVEPSEAMADITLDSISGDVKAEDWNTIATNESVALMITPTEVELQINPLEEQL